MTPVDQRALERAAAGLRLGLIVPAHNEARVIERRLCGLLAAPWPGGTHHRLVVVDDGSEDGTGTIARDLLESGGLGPCVHAEVLANTGRPGKPGAVETGLAAMKDAHGVWRVDVVILSDADVVLGPDALLQLARAFRVDPDLALACGSQHFVTELGSSGQPEGVDGAALVEAPGHYDRWTAWIRRLESHGGRLFSVHGQLLAWRSRLDLAPRAGFAADDLDLVLQLRERRRTTSDPWRVALVPEARFYEVKTPPGPGAREQALRRARAYVQVLRASCPPEGDRVGRLQWRAYRTLPLFAPELVPAGLVLGLLLVAWPSPPAAAFLAAIGIALAFTTPGRELRGLLSVIRRARRLESQGAQPERWEMAR